MGLPKKLFIVLFALVILAGVSPAQPDPEAYEDPIYSAPSKDEPPAGICPVTRIKGDINACIKCHTIPSFKLQEAPINEGYELPYGAELIFAHGKPIVTYTIDDISIKPFCNFWQYLTWHPNLRHIRLEIDSFGGGMFSAKNIIGYMDEFKASGGLIETVVRGKAMSAGMMIFLNGTKGHRYISESAHLMWHELWTFKMFELETVSGSEDEAETLRHLMDTVNQWIADRCKLTKKQLDAMIHKKELWCNGTEAVKKYGFADKLIK